MSRPSDSFSGMAFGASCWRFGRLQVNFSKVAAVGSPTMNVTQLRASHTTLTGIPDDDRDGGIERVHSVATDARAYRTTSTHIDSTCVGVRSTQRYLPAGSVPSATEMVW